jgi:hypothetical protein
MTTPSTGLLVLAGTPIGDVDDASPRLRRVGCIGWRRRSASTSAAVSRRTSKATK